MQTETTGPARAHLSPGPCFSADGNFEYDYAFTLPGNARTISHVIVQVPNDFTDADILPGTTPGGTIGVWDGQGSSNLGIPAALYGIKWNTSATPSTSFTWTIVTNAAPMTGNFYARDGAAGEGVYAYSGTKDVFGNNVVVPGSTVLTPVPAAAHLFGSGLIGLGAVRKGVTLQDR
jgi:hypothetical protein